MILEHEEISKAKFYWEQYVQQTEYEEEISNLKKGKSGQLIQQFGLYLDSSNLIRCKGRLANADIAFDAKNPKLLPSKGNYTNLLTISYHKRLCHAGVTQTLAQLRYEYWIPKGRSVVRSVIHKCPTCIKWESGPFKLPSFPNLPMSRVKETAPFTFVGLDYFGPLFVKNGTLTTKVWVCMFTCLTIRAIHMEIICDMSSDQFLLCFRRFVARRGRPSQIISDNAPQFKLAKSVIDRQWQTIIDDTDVKTFSSEKQIKWKFIVELAPWMRGFYEHLIGIIKRSLKKSVGSLSLTYDQLNTILTEVESMVNCRPLVYVGDDITSGHAQTPSCFLSLNPKQGFPDVSDEFAKDPSYIHKASKTETLSLIRKQGQKHLSTFWKCWIEGYLLSLRERKSSCVKQQCKVVRTDPVVGQVVLLKQPLSPRGLWKLARIIEINQSTDGKIRSAIVRTANGKTYTRSISMLYPLECNKTTYPVNNTNSNPHVHQTHVPRD